jgi:hypothetical protein
MRKNCIKVIEAFQKDKAAQGDSKRTIWTDGEGRIYSYNMLIARKFKDNFGGEMVVIIDRSYAPSATTRNKIDAVRAYYPNAGTVREGSILTWDFKFNSSY